MTSTKMLGSLGLLLGLALVQTTDAPGHGREPLRYGTMSVFDGKDYFGNVIRDGDRFVVIRFRQGDRIQRPRNFKIPAPGTLEVDDKYLGYDLRGKNKKVLVRGEFYRHSDQEIRGEFERTGRPVRVDIRQDIRWEVVSSEKESPFFAYFRVKNGEMKGWWIGLGSVEQEKKGERLPRNRQGERAPLILVKDKKDAAGFRWTRPEDEESR